MMPKTPKGKWEKRFPLIYAAMIVILVVSILYLEKTTP